MGKKSKTTDTAAKIAALEKVANDKNLPKKARKAAKAEIAVLQGVFVPSEATGANQAEPSSPSTGGAAPAVSLADSESAAAKETGEAWREKQDAEVARQWAHHTAALAGEVMDPTGIAADLIVEEPMPILAPLDADRINVDDDGTIRFLPEQRDPLEVGTGDAVDVAGNPVEPAPVAAAAEPNPLLKPEDPVLTNGNGQPVIHYIDPITGKEKAKGYTRVTTYIDCLDDKSNLDRWRLRVLLEGGAVELLQNDGASPSLEAVARAVGRLDAAIADIDRREQVEGELLGLRRQEVLKEHKDLVGKIAEDLLDLGGAHDAATKGTDLHRLTEIVDNGQPLPAGTSESDRRDVEAYLAAKDAAGLQVLWTERRVVLDDIGVSGTMDRAYMVKLPGAQRRVRVVGDVKTGRIDYAPGKIGMQLALYARGLGYDWTKPLERERLSLNQHTGLLIHLPQGEGRCTIYTVDLELASRGLGLAREVREWRNTGKRVFDIKKPLSAVER